MGQNGLGQYYVKRATEYVLLCIDSIKILQSYNSMQQFAIYKRKDLILLWEMQVRIQLQNTKAS